MLLSSTWFRLSPSLFLSLFLLFTPGWAAYAQGTVSTSFDAAGLSSLRYGNVEFLAYGDLRLNQLVFKKPNGTMANGVLTSSVVVNSATGRITRSYPWGSIITTYTVVGNRLNATMTVNNQSPDTIERFWLEPLGLKFPSRIQEYNGSIPLITNTLAGPAVAQASYGSGVLVVAADDVAKPLQIGFPWSFDAPNHTRFPLSLNTGRVSMLPDSYPNIKRPIAPGASDQFTFSLRFGPAGSTLQSLAGDTYQSFAAAYPSTLTWSDKRGIGALFLSTAAAGWPTNPRGWMIDPTINVFTPAGIADLKRKTLAYADVAIGVLKGMNAQGMITWDIEGQQYPHAISYVGDPRQFSTLAPEMAGIADEYFKKFRDAGLKVGVCLRPQNFVLTGNTAQQISIPDPTQLLKDKVAYAKARWGATIFYVDSNVTSDTDSNPIDVTIFQQLSAMYPDSLFVPEHATLRYYAYTAPYKELRQGYLGTPASVRQVYPNAMTILHTVDGPIVQKNSELVAAVRSGDVLMFRGWFEDSQNSLVKSIYQQAGTTTAQLFPPSVSIANPANGSSVANSVSVTAVASGGAPIAGVQFKLDGSNLGGEILSVPYQTIFDTRSVANGTHTLNAFARDIAGNTGTASITINVNNLLPPPQISLIGVTNGTTVAGTASWSAAVRGSAPIVGVRYQIDGAALGGEITVAPYLAQIDTRTLTNGFHVLTATARDQQGQTGAANVNFMVNNIAVLPTACPPPATGAFSGCYYSDSNFTSLRLVRADPAINFAWGNGSPDASIPVDRFSARWRGNHSFAAGTYNFALTSDDGARLYVDGQVVIDHWGDHPAYTKTAQLSLTAGWHLVAVDYYENAGAATSQLTWNLTTPPPVVLPPPAPVIPLSISVTSPITGSQIAGTVTLSSVAIAGAGTTVQFRLNGSPLGPALNTAPFRTGFNSTTMPNGTYTLDASVRDNTNVVAYSQPISITINNVTAPPIVTNNGCPVGQNTFIGCYYSFRDLTNLKLVRTDGVINFNWPYAALADGVGPENFSVRWQGAFQFEAAEYEFVMATDDGSRLFIDDQEVLNAWYEHSAIPFAVRRTLTAGTHRIRLEYFQMGGKASAALTWTRR